MNKVVFRYGLYSGITIVALFLISFLAFGSSEDYTLREIWGYSSMIVSLLFVFFGIKHYRDQLNGGRLSFGKGMKVGLLIVLVPSIIFGLFNALYVLVLNPGFMDEYYADQLSRLKNLPPAEYEAQKAMMESQKAFFDNPFVSSFVMFLTVFIIGVIITVISSLILRRNAARVATY